jgi:hypothetical protein
MDDLASELFAIIEHYRHEGFQPSLIALTNATGDVQVTSTFTTIADIVGLLNAIIAGLTDHTNANSDDASLLH